MIPATQSKQALSRVALGAFALFVGQMVWGQQSAPTNWTAEQDHQNMMDQLGIKALRPGPSGNEKEPNHANYDEAKADRKSTRLNSSHLKLSRMPSSA